MSSSDNRLRDLLMHRNIKEKEREEMKGMRHSSIAALKKNASVPADVLAKIGADSGRKTGRFMKR